MLVLRRTNAVLYCIFLEFYSYSIRSNGDLDRLGRVVRRARGSHGVRIVSHSSSLTFIVLFSLNGESGDGQTVAT